MRYELTLTVNGEEVGRSKFSHERLSFEEITNHGEHLYFKYVDGPNGPPTYPKAILTVKTSEGTSQIERDGWNMATPRNWRELTKVPSTPMIPVVATPRVSHKAAARQARRAARV